MGNVLDKTKQEQVIALGRLGWSLRQIELATGIRRETAGGYLRSAGVALRAPGGWGHEPPEPVTLATTVGADSKPAIEVTTGCGCPNPGYGSKRANEVTTGFLPLATAPELDRKRTASASEVYRETILLELSRGRNAMGIWQLCRSRHSCQNAEFSTMPSRCHLSQTFVLQSPGVQGILSGPLD